jgi:tetratricopeptide (TPR) repeat protein
MSSYESLGRGEEGLRFIQEAAEAHPEEGLLHHILGNAYRSLGGPTDAVAAYKEALRLSPDNGDTYNALGQAYAQLDSLDLAASCFRAASHLGIRWIRRSGPHLFLAHVYLLWGMREDAENEIMKAIEIDPGLSQAYAMLGLAYAHQDRYGEAVGEFKKATETTPDLVYWDLFYALLLHKVGRAEEGRAHLRQLADSFEGDPWAKSVIGFLTGSVNEATLLSLTKSDKPTTERERKCEAYYYIGMAYLLETDAELESRHPDTAKAQHYFEQCLSSSIWGYFEPVFAQIELAWLKAE